MVTLSETRETQEQQMRNPLAPVTTLAARARAWIGAQVAARVSPAHRDIIRDVFITSRRLLLAGFLIILSFAVYAELAEGAHHFAQTFMEGYHAAEQGR
jgi:hypothetical protein